MLSSIFPGNMNVLWQSTEAFYFKFEEVMILVSIYSERLIYHF